MPAPILVQAFGETRSIRAWASDGRCAVPYVTLADRLRKGWNAEEAIVIEAGCAPKPSFPDSTSAHSDPNRTRYVGAKLTDAQRALVVQEVPCAQRMAATMARDAEDFEECFSVALGALCVAALSHPGEGCFGAYAVITIRHAIYRWWDLRGRWSIDVLVA
jgi:hypothetical protein